MKLNGIDIVEFNVDEQQLYESFYNKSVNLSLSQDWIYGSINSAFRRWKVRRYKVFKNGLVIAVYQVYEKNLSFFPFLKIIYLNRGPIFQNNLLNTDIDEVYNSLTRKYKLWKGNFLLVNPLIEVSTENFNLLSKAGFYQYNKKEYWTSYLDLSLNDDLLRAQLKSKWRNQLVGAEKKDIRVYTDESGTFDQFLINKYKEMVLRKNFQGLSIDFIEKLFTEYRKSNRLFNFYAFADNGDPIAYTSIICYGSQCMYLIGWISDEHKHLNPSNLLLWRAILEMKHREFKSFDLGGMDPNFPGITKFKQGTGAMDFRSYQSWVLVR